MYLEIVLKVQSEIKYAKWRQFCNLETNGISRAKFGHLKDKNFQFSSVTLPNNNKQVLTGQNSKKE